MGTYNYLKPNAHQMGKKGVVQKKDGMFMNMPAFPELAGFKDSGCLHEKDFHLSLEKSPSTRKGKPI